MCHLITNDTIRYRIFQQTPRIIAEKSGEDPSARRKPKLPMAVGLIALRVSAKIKPSPLDSGVRGLRTRVCAKVQRISQITQRKPKPPMAVGFIALRVSAKIKQSPSGSVLFLVETRGLEPMTSRM